MRPPLIVACLLVMSVPASAGDKLQVTKTECLRLFQHQPAPDVAFKPGVDVYGRKVAPADVPNASPFQVPSEIVIDFSVDLNEKYGIGQDAEGNKRYSATTETFGNVRVDPLSGKVTYGGQPLDGVDTEAIRDACRREYGLR